MGATSSGRGERVTAAASPGFGIGMEADVGAGGASASGRRGTEVGGLRVAERGE